ncbi:MAG: hypothetical protein ABL901_09130 [Hyphomicrobiaceae bacterium]
MLDELPSLSDLEGLGWSLWWALGPTIIQVWLIVRSYREERRLRRQLAEAKKTIADLRDEHKLALAMGADLDALAAVEAERDELLDALDQIIKEPNPVTVQDIAHEALGLPFWPALRRVA